MQRVTGEAETGNVVVTTAGVVSTNFVLGSFPGATISVFLTGTNNLASLFGDNGVTPKANPFTAASDGSWFFYAANGRYDITIVGTVGGVSVNRSIGDVLLNDFASVTVTPVTVAFAAAAVYDLNVASWFVTTLTGNLTAPTFPNAVKGSFLYLTLIQDGVGGRVVTWPAAFLRPPVIAAQANAVTELSFKYDGTNWRTISASGDNTQLRVANNIRFADQFANIQAAINDAGATGAVLIPSSYTGTDGYTNPGNATAVIDLRHGNLQTWHIVQPSYPTIDGSSRAIPLGNDLLLQSQGAADLHIANTASDTTSTTSVGAPGSVTVTVGTTANFYLGASIIIEPSGANEETIAIGNWSAPSGTTITATFAKTHTQPYTIRQVGILFLDTGTVEITGDGKHAFVALNDGQSNLIAKLPINTGGSFPNTAWQWNAIQTGNPSITYRNSAASANFSWLNSANTGTLMQLTESGNGPILTFSTPTNTPYKIGASNTDLPRFYFGGTSKGAIFYSSDAGTGTSGIVRVRNNATDDLDKVQLDGGTGNVTATDFVGTIGATTPAAGSFTTLKGTMTGGGSSVTLLNSQDPGGAITGDGTDKTIYTYSLPANTMQAGKGIRIKIAALNGSAAATTYKIKFGATTVWTGTTAAATDAVWAEVTVFNNAAVQNAQHTTAMGFAAATSAGNAVTTPAENTALAVTILLTANVANPNTFTGKGMIVELIQ